MMSPAKERWFLAALDRLNGGMALGDVTDWLAAEVAAGRCRLSSDEIAYIEAILARTPV